MSDVVEAIRGAFALVFGGFIILVFAQAIAGTALDTGVFDFGLVGIVAILGGIVLIVTAIAALIGRLFP